MGAHRRSDLEPFPPDARRPLPPPLTAFVLAACGGGDDHSAPPPTSGMTITTLSNRADLVSGGSAAGRDQQARLRAARHAEGRARRHRHHVGVRAPAERPDPGRRHRAEERRERHHRHGHRRQHRRRAARHHQPPDRRPGAAGGADRAVRLRDARCRSAAAGNTPASNASGLSTAATDAQCNIAKRDQALLPHRPVALGDGGCSFVLPDPTPTIANPNPTTPANSCFQPYVAGTTPAALGRQHDDARRGVTVPYIVRVERGT